MKTMLFNKLIHVINEQKTPDDKFRLWVDFVLSTSPKPDSVSNKKTTKKDHKKIASEWAKKIISRMKILDYK